MPQGTEERKTFQSFLNLRGTPRPEFALLTVQQLSRAKAGEIKLFFFKKKENWLSFFIGKKKSVLAGAAFFLARVRERLHVTRNGTNNYKQLPGKFESSRTLLIVGQNNLSNPRYFSFPPHNRVEISRRQKLK